MRDPIRLKQCPHGKPIPGECLACNIVARIDERKDMEIRMLTLELKNRLDRITQLENDLRAALEGTY